MSARLLVPRKAQIILLNPAGVANASQKIRRGNIFAIMVPACIHSISFDRETSRSQFENVLLERLQQLCVVSNRLFEHGLFEDGSGCTSQYKAGSAPQSWLTTPISWSYSVEDENRYPNLAVHPHYGPHACYTHCEKIGYRGSMQTQEVQKNFSCSVDRLRPTRRLLLRRGSHRRAEADV